MRTRDEIRRGSYAAICVVRRRYYASDVRTVVVIVHRVVVIIDKVVSAEDTKARAEAAAEILVVVVDTGIDNRDGDARASQAERILNVVAVKQRTALVKTGVHLTIGRQDGVDQPVVQTLFQTSLRQVTSNHR